MMGLGILWLRLKNVMLGFFNSFNFSLLPLENQKWPWKYNPLSRCISYKKSGWLSSQPCRGFSFVGAQKFTAAACWVGNARPPMAILKAWHVRQLEHRRPGAWPTKNDPQKMGESMVVNAELYITPIKWHYEWVTGGYNPYKWSYGSVLISGRGPILQKNHEWYSWYSVSNNFIILL